MLQKVPGEKLVGAAAVIAVSLSERLGLEELNVLANLLNAVGDNLAVIAAQREADKSHPKADRAAGPV